MFAHSFLVNKQEFARHRTKFALPPSFSSSSPSLSSSSSSPSLAGGARSSTTPLSAKDCTNLVVNLKRRDSLFLLASLLSPPLFALFPSPAKASKLGSVVDTLWANTTGAPADLYYPPTFEGLWDCRSELVKVETPLGLEMLDDTKKQQVDRARREDLGKGLIYQISFTKNEQGLIIADRAFNTASLLSLYMLPMNKSSPSDPSSSSSSPSIVDMERERSRLIAELRGRIEWNASDPNDLRINLGGGKRVFTRVTKRSNQPIPDSNRLECSEYFEQVFDSNSETGPRVTASRCFTKYKWRTQAQAQAQAQDPMALPEIVATQVVSDYLTPFDGNEMAAARTMGQAVSIYTYRMSFFRRTPSLAS